MQRGVSARLVIFLALTLVAVVYLVPSFVRELPPWWSQYLPTDRINLGLDLQGGTHLVLEVKVD
jgi:preprotein translocase subunit SecD